MYLLLTFLLFGTSEELIPHLRQEEDGLSVSGILSETLSFNKKDDDSEIAKKKQTFMKKTHKYNKNC